MELSSLQQYSSSSGQYSNPKIPQLPQSLGTRRVSIYPSVINEPILEEDDDEQDTEGAQGMHTMYNIIVVSIKVFTLYEVVHTNVSMFRLVEFCIEIQK